MSLKSLHLLWFKAYKILIRKESNILSLQQYVDQGTCHRLFQSLYYWYYISEMIPTVYFSHEFFPQMHTRVSVFISIQMQMN